MAARPSTARPASFSTRLAAVRLGDRRPAALARLVADEALRAIGGDRAVVWAYRAALRRLLLEQEGLPVDSVGVATGEGAAVVSGSRLWRGPVSGIRARLLEASFPGASEHADHLSFPLRAGDRLVGLLLIEHPPLTAPEDIEPAVGPFAEQAAALLHNDAQHAAAQRNEANLQALYETAGDMTSTLEPDAVLHAIAKRARALLDASISHVMLTDGETGDIAMRVSEGTTQPAFATLRLKRGSGLGGRVAERRTPFYTSDYLNDSRFGHDSTVDATVRAEGVRSIVGVPMIAGDSFIGVLFVAERTVRTFTDADVDVLLGLAHHAAIALRNAELYDRATAAVAKLEQINEIVHLQNTRLQRAEQLQSQLTPGNARRPGVERRRWPHGGLPGRPRDGVRRPPPGACGGGSVRRVRRAPVRGKGSSAACRGRGPCAKRSGPWRPASRPCSGRGWCCRSSPATRYWARSGSPGPSTRTAR